MEHQLPLAAVCRVLSAPRSTIYTRRGHGAALSGRARLRRKPRPHDGTIIPAAPSQRWGSDATVAWTRADGWVWVFVVVDHYTAEAWAHVAKTGDRFAALQLIYDAVVDRWGLLGHGRRHGRGFIRQASHPDQLLMKPAS